MASSADILAQFRLRTQIGASWAPDDLVLSWISVCVSQFDSSLALADVTERMYHPLILLMLEKYHLYRASLGANAFPVSSSGHGYTDKSVVVDKHLKMAAAVRKEYEEVCAKMDLGQTQVKVSRLLRDSFEMRSPVPADFVGAFSKRTLSATANGLEVTLFWDESRNPDFVSYTIYRHTSPGLEDLTTLTSDSAEHLGVISAATNVKRINERWKTFYKDSLASAGTYYYVVVEEISTGRIAVSNEVSVTGA